MPSSDEAQKKNGVVPDMTVVEADVLDKQSKQLSETERDHIGTLLANRGEFLRSPYDDCTTLYDVVRRGAKVSPNGDCLGYRASGDAPYTWISYNDVIARVENVAAGFLALGMAPGQKTFVGIYSANRPEWVIAEHACYMYNMVNVPLYDTLGAEACAFIIGQAEIELVICDHSKKAESLLSKTSTLQQLVVMESPSESLKAKAAEMGCSVISFNELEKLGATCEDRVPFQLPSPNDLCTICYTSGTTGTPKGAMLTHENLIADSTVLLMLDIDRTDTVVSYLPLAHMFERGVQTVMFLLGGRVGFSRGDIRLLSDDMQALKPTIYPVVPRVLSKLHDKCFTAAQQSWWKNALFKMALGAKVKQVEQGIIRKDTIWDTIVFGKIQQMLGGRVKLIITGAAPISDDLMKFTRAVIGCNVQEGYGQTECTACCTITLASDHRTGHVGPPIPCNTIKLVDVPELDYFARDDVGEVCVKGPNVFKGYFKEPEKTAETLDADGWLHTGDVGRWTSHGTLKIVDRKKHIFKLSQGEYIAPEKIENVYLQCHLVMQCFVYGSSLKASLVAIVVPDARALNDEAAKHLDGLEEPLVELCKNEKVNALVLASMVEKGKQVGLSSLEQVKKIFLLAEPFSVENNLLTPTLKTRRPAIAAAFKAQLDELYTSLE